MDDAVNLLLRQVWVVWLVLLFLGIVAWVYWPGRKPKMDRDARIPLEDDEPVRPRPTGRKEN
jgi:cytochrome c oxidase cbb3-type subunit 4